MSRPSPLQGGARRRRPNPVAILPLLVLVAAAAVYAADNHVLRGDHHRVPAQHAAAGAHRSLPPPVRRPAIRRPAPPPRNRYATLPAPTPPLRVHLRKPPLSGLVWALSSGRVLWSRNPNRVLPIASVTKMMTGLLAVAHNSPRTPVLVTKSALAYKGSGVGVLPAGKEIPTETMLYGLLLPSGNDAAIALAQSVAGTVHRFIALMNARARRMGLRCTHFSSPDGFQDRGNVSCAHDLAALARAVLAQPRLASIVRRRHIRVRFPIKGRYLDLWNNNTLMRLRYPGVLGVKTGFTAKAGHCLVAVVQHHGMRLGIVLLHSPDTGDQARKLLDRAFAAVGR